MRPNRSTAARTAASASARLVTSSLTASSSFDWPKALDTAALSRPEGHNRVTGRQGGFAKSTPMPSAGSSDKPNLFVTHDTSVPGASVAAGLILRKYISAWILAGC